MKTVLNNESSELSQGKKEVIEGGLFGIAWLTGAILTKIFAGGVALGVVGAICYLLF